MWELSENKTITMAVLWEITVNSIISTMNRKFIYHFILAFFWYSIAIYALIFFFFFNFCISSVLQKHSQRVTTKIIYCSCTNNWNTIIVNLFVRNAIVFQYHIFLLPFFFRDSWKQEMLMDLCIACAQNFPGNILDLCIPLYVSSISIFIS